MKDPNAAMTLAGRLIALLAQDRTSEVAEIVGALDQPDAVSLAFAATVLSEKTLTDCCGVEAAQRYGEQIQLEALMQLTPEENS